MKEKSNVMSGRIVQLDADTHQAVQALLPWYVTQRLPPQDLAHVQTHLADCPRCQAELAHERKLQAAYAEIDAPAGDVEHGWAAMRAQMAADGKRSNPLAELMPWLRDGAAGLHRQWRAGAPWLRWGLAAQFAVIAMLVAAVLTTAPAYHLLGNTAGPAQGNLVVKFRPDATENDLRQALRDSGARLVDGPTVTDAYVLNVSEAQRSTALARLRAQRAVALAESLDAGGSR
jgi:anti-sigma factor RsiW